MPAIDLNHVSISTRDFDESLRFYTEFLGLEHIPTPTMSVRVEWLRVGQRQIHLFPESEPVPDRHHLAFEIDNFEELYLAAIEQGHLVDVPGFAAATLLPDGSGQMYLRDPSGNLIELTQRDVSQVDRKRVPLRALAEDFPQSAENLRATLYLYPQLCNEQMS
ncbi:MAG: VOC family protein [Thermoleophilia bacterium]|nr:VOC family protein [Thermoleophilia bacterium]